jgi:hypothetical protein
MAAVIAGLAYTNFGQFNRWPPLHTRELFHYFLGSKYYPELKHDGLYVASMSAQYQSHPEFEVQPHIRDLRTNRIAPLQSLEDHYREVRDRFEDARWNQFVADHDFFATPETYHWLTLFRLDHGYNPSPTWTFLARLLSTRMQAGDRSFLFLASLDFLLMGALCFGIFKVYGGRVAAMVVLLLGLGAPWRYDWIGGAFLRADWLAALGLGICALKRERFALAGGLIGYAAMIRIFPAAFLVGPALVALRQWTEGSPPRWFPRFVAGVLVAVTLGFGVGGLNGNGFATWPDFFKNVGLHLESEPSNGVGLKNAILADRALSSREETSTSLVEGSMRRESSMEQAATERWPLTAAGSLLLIAMTLAAMWNRPPHEAAVLGSVLLFSALSMASYYWIVLALVPLAGALWLPTAAVLAVSALVFGMILNAGEQLGRVYGVASWALLILFVLWLVPWSMKSLRSIANSAGSRRRSTPPPAN